MPQPLMIVPADDPNRVHDALRDALAGGPAVFPRAAGAPAVAGLAAVPGDAAVVVETSGSTSAPKRVVLSRDALLASAAGSDEALSLPSGKRQWLLCLPTHYVAGVQVLVRSIVAGTRPVVDVAGHFDPWRLARAAAALTAPVRLVSVVPVQLARLWRAAVSDPSLAAVVRRFDRILVGGQALETSLFERAVEAGFHVVRTYGSSETAGGCVYDGVPFGAVRARIVDDMVELSGPVLADGYLGDAERTARAFHLETRPGGDAGVPPADGAAGAASATAGGPVPQGGVPAQTRWYRTGDLGVFSDGRLRVLGRADNVIISGGEKVLLDAVEACVDRLPGLADAVVVGVHDDEWGQVPVVVVASEPGTARGGTEHGQAGDVTAHGAEAPELAAVRGRVAPVLGRQAAPAALVRLDRMPRLASGKPDRRRIARLAAARMRATAAGNAGQADRRMTMEPGR